jgi:hypothetical protein
MISRFVETSAGATGDASSETTATEEADNTGGEVDDALGTVDLLLTR